MAGLQAVRSSTSLIQPLGPPMRGARSGFVDTVFSGVEATLRRRGPVVRIGFTGKAHALPGAPAFMRVNLPRVGGKAHGVTVTFTPNADPRRQAWELSKALTAARLPGYSIIREGDRVAITRLAVEPR